MNTKWIFWISAAGIVTSIASQAQDDREKKAFFAGFSAACGAVAMAMLLSRK